MFRIVTAYLYDNNYLSYMISKHSSILFAYIINIESFNVYVMYRIV